MGLFGAAFSPVILLSLFWKRLTLSGVLAGILSGAVVDVLWLIFLSGTGIYEIIPGFIVSLFVTILVSKCSEAPSKEVQALYERAAARVD